MPAFPTRRDASTITEEWFRRFIRVPASAMRSPLPGGAADHVGIFTNMVEDFKAFDKDTEERVYFSFIVPQRFIHDDDESRIRWQMRWATEGGTVSQTFALEVAILALANNESLNGNFTTIGTITDTHVGVDDLHTSSYLEQTANLPIAENEVFVRLTRKTGSDNLAADALLHSVSIEFWS